jgi:outer membrane immunogenic protein
MKSGEIDMKKFTLAAATFAALTGSAIAADLPRKGPAYVAPAPVPVATWTGCYLTGGIGYGMWNQDNQVFDGGVALDAQHTDGGRGWLGRVGGGCDYQFWQRFVVGALADYDFANLKGNISAPSLGNIGGEEKMNWAWAAGGRLGYLPWDTLMVYVSGGYTQAHFNGTIFTPDANAFTTPGTTYSGWFLGSGYEYRFDWLPGLYWRTEYRFNSYNSKDIQLLSGGVPVTNAFIHSEKFVQTVTSSVVWRFNWWR